MRFCFFLSAIVAIVLCTSCVYLHHAQIGEIDNRLKGNFFDIKVSEMGINLDEAARIVSAVGGKREGQIAGQAAFWIGLFQMGPRTGNTVFNDTYAENLLRSLHERCPSGKITGLNSIRETNKYPVISGEIIRITGYCAG